MAELVKEGYLEVKTGSVFGSKYKKNYIRLFKGIPAVQGASSRRKKLTSKSSTPTVQITDGEISGSVHTVPLERAWSVAEKQSKSSKRWTFELHYDGVVIATFACSNMFEREEWLKAFESLKLQSRLNPMSQETYKAVVLRSEGASELGISGEYMLSVCDGALLLKTASGFEVQRWPHTQVRRLAKCPDTPGKLLLDIAHPAGGALSFQFSVDDSSLQRLQKDWHALLVEQCDVDRLGQVLALLNSDPETVSLPETDSEHRTRSSSLQSKPTADGHSGTQSQELLRFNSLRLPSTTAPKPPVPQRSRLSLFLSSFKEESLTKEEEEEEEEMKGAGGMEVSTIPALPPKAPDRMQQPSGIGVEGEAMDGATSHLAAQHKYLQVLPDDVDVKTPPTDVPPPAMQGGEGYRDHTYLPLLPDEDNKPAPAHQPHQRHNSTFGRRSIVIPDSHMYDSPPTPVYSCTSNPVQKKVVADELRTMSGDDSAVDLDSSRNSLIEPAVEDNTPYPTRDNPPHSTRESTPYPTRDNPSHSTRETTPYPTRDNPPHSTRESTPYPTGDNPSHSTRENTPYPTSSRGQSLQHPRDIPLKQCAMPVMSLDSSPKQHRVPFGVWATDTVSHHDKSHHDKSHDDESQHSVSHNLPSHSGREEMVLEHLQSTSFDTTSRADCSPLQTSPSRAGMDSEHQPTQCSGLASCSCAQCQLIGEVEPTPPPLPPRDDPPYYNIGARALDGAGTDSPPLPPRPPKPRLSRESSTGSSKGKSHHHCSCSRKHSHERMLERMNSSELSGRGGVAQQSSGGGVHPRVQQSSGGGAHTGVQHSSGGGSHTGVQQISGSGSHTGVQQISVSGSHTGVQQISVSGSHTGVQQISGSRTHPEVQQIPGSGSHTGVPRQSRAPLQEAQWEAERYAGSHSAPTPTSFNSLTKLPTSTPETIHELSEPVHGVLVQDTSYRQQGTATSCPGQANVTSSTLASNGASSQPRHPSLLQSNWNDVLPSAANATPSASPPTNQHASISDGEAALQEALDSLQNTVDYMCLKYDTSNDPEKAEEVLMIGASQSAVSASLDRTDSTPLSPRSEPHLLTESTHPAAHPMQCSVETNAMWQTNPTFAPAPSVAGSAPVHRPLPTPLVQPAPPFQDHSSSAPFDLAPSTRASAFTTLYTREGNVLNQFPSMGSSPAHLAQAVAVPVPATSAGAFPPPFTADRTVPYCLSSVGLSPTHPSSMRIIPTPSTSSGSVPSCLSTPSDTLPTYPATAHITANSLTSKSVAPDRAPSIATPTLSQMLPSTQHLQLGLEAKCDRDGHPEPEPYLNPVVTPTEAKPLPTSVRKHAPLKRVAGENPRTAISSHPSRPPSRPRSMLNGDAHSGSDLLHEMKQRVKRFDSQNSQNSDSSMSSDGRSSVSTRFPRNSGHKHRSGSGGQMQLVVRGISATPPPVPPRDVSPRDVPPRRSRTSFSQVELEGFHSRPPLKAQDTSQSLDSALLSQALARAAPHSSAGLLDELAERVAMKMGAGVGTMPDMAPVQATQLRHHVQPRH